MKEDNFAFLYYSFPVSNRTRTVVIWWKITIYIKSPILKTRYKFNCESRYLRLKTARPHILIRLHWKWGQLFCYPFSRQRQSLSPQKSPRKFATVHHYMLELLIISSWFLNIYIRETATFPNQERLPNF